eukprot:7619014-Pyramimonas_sp.AAC.1
MALWFAQALLCTSGLQNTWLLCRAVVSTCIVVHAGAVVHTSDVAHTAVAMYSGIVVCTGEV